MALHAKGVAGFKDGSVGDRIRARCRGLFDYRDVITVCEVNMWMFRKAFEQFGRAHGIELVPAHVGHAFLDLEAFDCAGENAEAGLTGCFGTRVEESLQTEADSQKRDVRFNAGNQSRPHIHFIERAEHLTKVAYTRQDNFWRAFKTCGIAHEFVLRSDSVEGVLDGAKIACAVIENRDHSRPFVDGSWSLRRASVEAA